MWQLPYADISHGSFIGYVAGKVVRVQDWKLGCLMEVLLILDLDVSFARHVPISSAL
jgi:hypothetical protein